MDYLKHYNLLIARSRSRVKSSKEYYESHHVLPRCLGGTDDEFNLALLTPEEHYLAHQLLVKIYQDCPELAYAANMMCTNRSTNKLYGWIRRRISENMKLKNPNKDGLGRKKHIEKNGGPPQISKDHVTDEWKAKIGNSKKGKNNPQYGVKPWLHPRATNESKRMWSRADEYYDWWTSSGLEHGQNAMARSFNENYKMTHSNLVKYFRSGWVPKQDSDWIKFCDSCKI